MGILRIFGCLFFLTLFSCSTEEEVWQTKFEISDEKWLYDQILKAEWTPGDDIPESKLLIDVTHSPDFQYQNLYMVGHSEIDQKRYSNQDTFSVQLATSNSGRWLGTTISENQIVKTDTIQILPAIKKGQTLRLSIQQYSRDSILTNIHKIEFRIIPAGS